MVIDAPTAPVLGVRLVMLGAEKAAIEKDKINTLKTARRIILTLPYSQPRIQQPKIHSKNIWGTLYS
jgi:hypothetical protein